MTILTKNTDLLKREVAQHIAADAVVQGTYWENHKGCFIGCLAHSSDPRLVVERYGLTLQILLIAESIFEALPIGEAKQFFADFADAVDDGKDLSLVHIKFLAETLRNLPVQKPYIQSVITPVITGLDHLAAGGHWPAAEAAAMAADRAAGAADVARAAAMAAAAAGAAARAAAARAAAAGAGAADVARAAAMAAAAAGAAAAGAGADAVVAAARAAARAADVARAAAAEAAARAAEVRRQRDSLLELIHTAPFSIISPFPKSNHDHTTHN